MIVFLMGEGFAHECCLQKGGNFSIIRQMSILSGKGCCGEIITILLEEDDADL
jgi:hypothetical protein